MKKVRRIALFSPYHTFYIDVLFGLARAFNALGVKTNVMPRLLEPDGLNTFCRQYRPSAILEINRTRSELPEFPLEIPHIAWVQDYGHGLCKNVSISELTYFLVDPAALGYEELPIRFSSIMLPGADDKVYTHKATEFETDFSFVGYMPEPIHREILEKAIVEVVETGQRVTYGEIIHHILNYLDRPGYLHADVSEIRREVYDFIRKRLPNLSDDQIPTIPEKAMGLFDKILIRIRDRARLLDEVLTVSNSMRIFGPAQWKKWPQYKDYYQGYLYDQAELRNVFQSTRLNLHNNCNGFSMHFRVMDCMASGGCILVNEGLLDEVDGGIKKYFQPDVHYVPYRYETVADVCAEYLADPERFRKIGMAAAQEIHANHTWRHRALQIIEDLKRVA